MFSTPTPRIGRRVAIAMLAGVFVAAALPAGAWAQGDARGLVASVAEFGAEPHDLIGCDLDGDGISDILAFDVGPAHAIAWVRRDAAGKLAPPRFAALPANTEAVFIASNGADGRAVLRVAVGEAILNLLPAGFGPTPPAESAGGSAPPFLGFVPDQDGDGLGDPLLPRTGRLVLALSKDARQVDVRPALQAATAAGSRGFVATRTSYAVPGFERLLPTDPLRPLWFREDTLWALRGDLAHGFGPECDAVVRLGDGNAPPPSLLERTEARLADLDGDGRHELIVVRTKTSADALADVRTELLFHRLGGATPSKPVQAILLPGVLSSGPDLADQDGDGHPDLLVSVFGQDLKQQLARRITGKTELAYHIYRGTGQAAPFGRTPEVTLTDQVPSALFDRWWLRHRYLLSDDWTGDGKADLVEVSDVTKAPRFSIRAGMITDGKLAFETEARATVTLNRPVLDHRPWRLGPGQPAILCRTATGLAVITRAR